MTMRGIYTAWRKGMPHLVWFLLLSPCLFAQGGVEVGSIKGAQFRIRVPETWNRFLVLWCDGYATTPRTFQPEEKPGSFAEELLRQGYAYAESGYSAGGVAVAEGVADTDALRQYFAKKYGRPARIVVVGESMGGLIALSLVESHPSEYQGGLAFCGLLSAPYMYLQRVFDLLVLHQRYFPDILPSPAQVPETYAPDEKLLNSILGSLDRNASAAATLRSYWGVRNNQELAGLLMFSTDALRDLQRRSGGNPFDNHDTLYTVGADSVAVNREVPRYAADHKAEAFARKLVVPAETLAAPFLAVDAAYDPVIPSWSGNEYTQRVRERGNQLWFVRQFVLQEGHCYVEEEQRLKAFRSLVEWSAGGARPLDGLR
jgi:alpha-beta hydrolase superfamily lysophospholipase